MMLLQITIWFLALKSVLTQLNGEFWWLNTKVSDYHHKTIPPPKFEDLSEHDNDESSVILFKDKDIFANSKQENTTDNKIENIKIYKVTAYDHSQDENKIVWPSDIKKNKDTIGSNFTEDGLQKQLKKDNPLPPKSPPENRTELTESNLDAVFFFNGKQTSLQNIDHLQDENKIMWPNDIKKQKVNTVSRTENGKQRELKKDNPLPQKNTIEFTFQSTEAETGNYILKNKPTIYTEKTSSPPENLTEPTESNIDAVVFFNDKQTSLQNIDKLKAHDHMKDDNIVVSLSDMKNKKLNTISQTENGKQKQQKKYSFLPQKNRTETFQFPDAKSDNYIMRTTPTSSTEKSALLPENSTQSNESNADTVVSFTDKKLSLQKNYQFKVNTAKSHEHPLYGSKILWPSDIQKNKVTIGGSFSKFDIQKPSKKENLYTDKNKDEFSFKFPEKDSYILKDTPTSTSEKTVSLPENYTGVIKNSSNAEFLFSDNITSVHKEEETQAQNICTYMKKNECNIRNGFIYDYELGKSLRKGPKDPQLICCVLPLPINDNKKGYKNKNNENFKVLFPNTLPKRNKRSNDEAISTALKQRNILMQRKYENLPQKVRQSSTQTKIDPDSDEDPYWNIKNPKLQYPKIQTNQKKIDITEDYVQDYLEELPKPGLVGLYSDHEPSGWTFGNEGSYGGDIVYDDVDDTDSSYGYSSIDPRLGQKAKTSGATTYDAESQIIRFQSDPDFHVFQGFKLLNLVRNRNKFHPDNARKTITEASGENKSKESLVIRPFEKSSDSDDDEFLEDQLYKECGNVMQLSKANEKGKMIGEAEIGTHPWLALVLLTKNMHHILCYATLVHPRAAITAADCVYGTSSGEITLSIGQWDLGERSRSTSRIPSIHLHPKFSHGDLAHGLAVLNWMRPFRLKVNVQPACLADPYTSNDCKFFGWGGFGQAIRPRSRWQRATIRACRTVYSNKDGDLPSNAFCVTVHSRGTVTGIGGPLICNMDGRQAVVGVAVSRDSAIVLLPARDWAMATGSLINGN